MHLLLTVSVVATLIISPCHGDLTLFPVGKRLEYKWQAKMTTGTVLPTELKNAWTLTTTVVVEQQSDNTTLFKIQEIKESVGSLANNQTALQLPFKAIYSNGEITGVVVNPDDDTWSVNIKRALLSIFQLKLESLAVPAFSATEANLYGNCKVEYSVRNVPPRDLKVRKLVDIDSCVGLPIDHFSTAPHYYFQSYEDADSSDSEKIYFLSPFEEVFIKHINATGVILIQPYQAKSEAHYSKIVQSLTFENIQTISEENQITIGPDEQDTGIVYERISLDPTFGKPPDNSSELVDEVSSLLGELSDSLSTWEVGVKGLDNQTAFHILDLMWWLSTDDWERLFSIVSIGTSYRQETIQHLFWELVPQVGSEASSFFIRDLILDGRVKAMMAGRLLAHFPFHVREPTEELLTQFETFLRPGEEVSTDIRSSAVLSFASLIFRTCKINPCKPDTMDRYAKIYLDKFTESILYEDKMLYLQGLANMELSQAIEFLSPVVSGMASTDKHLRFLASWATLHTVHGNSDKIFEVFWPVFVNRSEALELRVVSLTLLIMSKPTASRFFSIYWFMQGEQCEQLYNYYYTTIHSMSTTNYPPYTQLGKAANRLARYVPPKSRLWATGNYLLDFEDQDRAYGGLLQTLLIASERTGLPNVFMFITEQHALAHSKSYAVYLKVEGLAAAISEELSKLSLVSNPEMNKVFTLLQDLKVAIHEPESVHLEFILKIDGRVVMCQYLNKSSLNEWINTIKRASSLYFEFSVNYQSLAFPLKLMTVRPSDIGSPALVQIRSSALTSARGSIGQDNEGRARNAELDLRYSWNGITTLRVYNPFNNTWSGADHCRNLHIRLPFATQLNLHVAKSFFKVTAVRHRDFVTGSRLGLVWHSSTRLVSRKATPVVFPDISDEWSMDSEDLGARLGASVFDCSPPDALADSLHLLKRSFQVDHKNHHMVPGGVILLGLLSLKDQLQFQPAGSSCGVMLYFTPLFTKVEPVLLVEGNQISLSMTRPDGQLWTIQAGSKRTSDGNKEFAFKLYRAPSVSVSVAHIWRVIQLEGAFIVPSRMAGVFQPPAALTGYAFVSWGDAAPSNADKAAMIDLKVVPGNNETETLECRDFIPGCLQAASDLAARQTATLEYANLPTWLKMAAHALVPEHIQTESSRTQITFAYPVALLPWNTKGLCAINGRSALTLDNATVTTDLDKDCYSLAVADCSNRTQYAVLVKKHLGLLATKVITGNQEVELIPAKNQITSVILNGSKMDNITDGYSDGPKPELSVRMRGEGVMEVELGRGVTLHHYNSSIVVLIPAAYRGYTCGICGDFNGDTNGEPSNPYTQC